MEKRMPAKRNIEPSKPDPVTEVREPSNVRPPDQPTPERPPPSESAGESEESEGSE